MFYLVSWELNRLARFPGSGELLQKGGNIRSKLEN
jgi:hypothetical protein